MARPIAPVTTMEGIGKSAEINGITINLLDSGAIIMRNHEHYTTISLAAESNRITVLGPGSSNEIGRVIEDAELAAGMRAQAENLKEKSVHWTTARDTQKLIDSAVESVAKVTPDMILPYGAAPVTEIEGGKTAEYNRMKVGQANDGSAMLKDVYSDTVVVAMADSTNVTVIRPNQEPVVVDNATLSAGIKQTTVKAFEDGKLDWIESGIDMRALVRDAVKIAEASKPVLDTSNIIGAAETVSPKSAVTADINGQVNQR